MSDYILYIYMGRICKGEIKAKVKKSLVKLLETGCRSDAPQPCSAHAGDFPFFFFFFLLQIKGEADGR